MSDAQNAPVQPAAASSANNDTVLAAVATIPLIGLIIYFAMPTASDFVKFYAKQSIALLVVGVGLSIVSLVLGFIPFLGWILSLLIMVLDLVLLIAWVVLLINALQGNRYRLPVLADLADQLIK